MARLFCTSTLLAAGVAVLLVGLSGSIHAARQPADGAAPPARLELIVFERSSCLICRLFRRDVATDYLKSGRNARHQCASSTLIALMRRYRPANLIPALSTTSTCCRPPSSWNTTAKLRASKAILARRCSCVRLKRLYARCLNRQRQRRFQSGPPSAPDFPTGDLNKPALTLPSVDGVLASEDRGPNQWIADLF